MLITVAICTWNRCQILERCLEQMTKLIIPPDVEWELLVVNNNCTDATDEVIVSFSNRLPLRRLFEPKQGLSNARNLAASEARGSYILWTDDDVLIDHNWVAEYCNAFSCWPDALIFGGPIEPLFEGQKPPAWLQKCFTRVGTAYACRSFGETPAPIRDEHLPFGANYVVQTKKQILYPYDPQLGRIKDNLQGGEEIAVLTKMLNDGAKSWCIPSAKVRHIIPEHRQTIKYLRRFFYNVGRIEGAEKRFGNTPWNNENLLLGKPRWQWKRAIEAEIKYQFYRLIADPQVWMEDLIVASYLWGQLFGNIARRASDE